jgi:DNA-binding MurR/RpiR family transcriptional regulator
VKYAQARGARIVAITDSELSPLAPQADNMIIVQTETPSFFHTMAPAFAAVECLAALVAARHGPKALATLEASENQLAAFGTYVMPKKGRQRK